MDGMGYCMMLLEVLWGWLANPAYQQTAEGKRIILERMSTTFNEWQSNGIPMPQVQACFESYVNGLRIFQRSSCQQNDQGTLAEVNQLPGTNRNRWGDPHLVPFHAALQRIRPVHAHAGGIYTPMHIVTVLHLKRLCGSVEPSLFSAFSLQKQLDDLLLREQVHRGPVLREQALVLQLGFVKPTRPVASR